jgi:hypothetical protein
VGYPAEELGEGGRDVVAAFARYRTVIFGTVGCKNEVLDLACADGFYIFLAEVLDGAADLTGCMSGRKSGLWRTPSALRRRLQCQWLLSRLKNRPAQWSAANYAHYL